jgi:hypothetical protein
VPPTTGNTTPNTGAFTTLTSVNDATFNGLTVGHGAGNVSNNTVLGVTALDHNTTGQQNVAVGINALTTAITANNQTAVGYQALRLSTASDNTAVGSTALQTNSSGAGNVAVGFQTLTANTTGGSNTAIGRHALITNSTGSNITALGNHAGAYETGSNALYIDAYDRTNTAGDKAGALLYGTFNATPSSQTLTINGAVTIPYQLRIDSTLSLAGSTGTSGYVLTSNGASAPTWQTLPASGITITDDTTTNATRYLAFTSATSGTITGQNVASTKLQFNPSTGLLTATSFGGSGAGLTSIPNSALTNSSVTVTAGTGMSGGGSVALGSSVTLTNAGVTSLTAGTGISISASTGGVTITNTSSVNASQLCKAWVNWAGSSGTINSSYNVSSVTRNGTGNYTVNFTSSMPNSTYAVSCGVNRNNGAADAGGVGYFSQATGSTGVYTYAPQGSFNDPTSISVSIFSS